MSEQKQILEQYLRAEFSDKPALSITHIDKLADGWESDNYLITVEYGGCSIWLFLSRRARSAWG